MMIIKTYLIILMQYIYILIHLFILNNPILLYRIRNMFFVSRL